MNLGASDAPFQPMQGNRGMYRKRKTELFGEAGGCKKVLSSIARPLSKRLGTNTKEDGLILFGISQAVGKLPSPDYVLVKMWGW